MTLGVEIGVMWTQAKEIYSFTALKARSLKAVSPGQNQDVYRATFSLSSGGNFSLPLLASGGSKHSLTCSSMTPNSTSDFS